VELVEALPLIPRGRRVVHKGKAFVVEPTRYANAKRLVELSSLVVVECLLYLFCSPSASPPDPKPQKVVGAEFAGDGVPAGGSTETAGMDPSTTSAGVVTVAVAGISSGHPAPSACDSSCICNAIHIYC
jgi:hypothetical protein